MPKHSSLFVILAALTLTAACNDATDGKPKAAVGAAASGAAAPAAAGAITFDQGAGKVAFVASKVSLKHNCSFTKFSGNLSLKDGKAEGGSVRVEIETASVETDAPKLTGHLKSPDFFDVEKFPKAVFESTSVTAGGTGGATHTVTGNLDLHGAKKAISFPATLTVTDGKITVHAEFSINRKDFGIVYPGMPDDLINDQVLMKLDLDVPRAR